jgi:hypothetical protein
LRVH